MAENQKIFAISSDSSKFSDILEAVRDDADKNSYHLEKCGNIWLVKASGWTLQKLKNAIDKKLPQDNVPGFIVFEVKSDVTGYYSKSLWEWISSGDSDG